MKKLINRPEAVVEEMVEGLVAVYPGLRAPPWSRRWWSGAMPSRSATAGSP